MHHARCSIIAILAAAVLAACCCCPPAAKCPDLVVTSTTWDPVTRSVTATVKNVGDASAAAFLVYIEVNQIGAPASAKPESQHSETIGGLGSNTEHVIGPVPLSSFSARPTIDLATISSFELVVTVDAKGMVAECSEGNNTSVTTH